MGSSFFVDVSRAPGGGGVPNEMLIQLYWLIGPRLLVGVVPRPTDGNRTSGGGGVPGDRTRGILPGNQRTKTENNAQLGWMATSRVHL